MNDPTSTLTQAGLVTETALEAMHLQLLERRQNGDDASPKFLDEARHLIIRGRELGRLIDDPRARLDCQTVLNYWAIYLYRARQEQIEAHLQPYDPLTAPELRCECPYRLGGGGPTPLERSGGWSRLIDQAVQHLTQSGLVTVVGGAGSGRSVFVDRVLLPRLRSGGDEQSRIPASSTEWRYIDVVTGDRPFLGLIAAIRGTTVADASDSSSMRLARSPERVSALVDETGRRTVLIIRNLEHVLNLPQSEREPFFKALYAVVKEARVSFGVIATLRREGVVRLSRMDAFEIPFRQSQLPLAFTSAELRSFIEDPAAEVGLVFDPGVVDRIVSDLQGEPTALPLLQFTMRRLWDRRERNRITRDAYNRAGAGRVALEMEADSAARDRAGDADVLRETLRNMVQFEVGGVVSARAVSRAALIDAVGDVEALDRVLARLEQSDLIEQQPADGDTLYQIKHYALLTSWPQLIEWLDEWRFKHRLHLQLSRAAQQWAESGRDAGLLWRGPALAEAVEQLDIAALPGRERDFLEQSRVVERSARLRRRFVIGAGLALLIALFILLWLNENRRAATSGLEADLAKRESRESGLQKQIADAERAEAELRRNSAQFALWTSMLPDVQERLQRDDPTAALLLLRERRLLADRLRGSVLPGTMAGNLDAGRQTDAWRRGVALSQCPKLNWLWFPPSPGASGASHEGELVFRAIEPFREPAAVSSPDGAGTSAGLLILQGDEQETKPSRLWRWSPGAGSEPKLLSMETTDGRERPELAAVAVVSVRGRNFAVGAAPAEVSGLFVAPLEADPHFEFVGFGTGPQPADGVRRVFAGPDGRLATINHPLDRRYGELRLWQLVPDAAGLRVERLEIGFQGTDPHSLAEALSRVKLARFSPRGRWLLTIHNEPGRNEWDEQSHDELRLWDLHSGRVVGPPEMGSRPVQYWRLAGSDDLPAWMHDDLIRAVAFAPPGDPENEGADAAAPVEPDLELVTASANGKVEFWSILEEEEGQSPTLGPQFSPPLFHDGDVYDVTFDDRGRYLITASRDRTVRIWYTATHQEATPPLVHEGTVTRVVLAGGQLLASTDDVLRSWHVDRFAHRLKDQPSIDPSLRILAAHDTVPIARHEETAPYPAYRQLVIAGRRIEHGALDESGRFLFVAASPSRSSKGDRTASSEMIVLDALDLAPAGGSWVRSPFGIRPTAVAFGGAEGASHGHRLVALTEGNQISLWRFAEQEQPEPLPDFRPAESRDPISIHSLAFSPDGSALAVAGSTRIRANQHIGRVWLIPPGRTALPDETAALGECWRREDAFPQRVRFVSFAGNAGSAYLVTGEQSNRAQVFQVRPDLRCDVPPFTHTSDVIAAALRPREEGFRLVTVSSGGEVRLWEVRSSANREPQGRAILAHGGKVDRAIFSPDGELVVTAAQDRSVRLWHFSSGELIGVFRLGSTVSDMRFVDDHVLLTVGRRESSQATEDSLSVRLWNIRQDVETDPDGERGKKRFELLASRQLDESGAIMRPLQPLELRERADAVEEEALRNDFGMIYRFEGP